MIANIFKSLVALAILLPVAWVLLGFPEVTHEAGCTRINSEFLRSFDYIDCDMDPVEVYLKGIPPIFAVAFIFMVIRALTKKIPDEHEDLR